MWGTPAGFASSHDGESLDGTVILSGRVKGGAPQGIQAVDQDERAGQVLPTFGDGVLHLV